MSVGVNLIVCNRTPEHRRATEVAVRSLLESDLDERTTLLAAVDNGSADDTADWLRENWFDVERLDANVGIAPARNRVTARLLDAGVWAIVEMHNDMIFPRSWLGALLGALEADERIGLASASLLTPRGTLGSPKVPIDYAWEYETIVGRVDGEALRAARPGILRDGLQHPVAKRAAMLRQIGLYDEAFEWGNFEDTDEVYRARKAGWRDVVVGGAVVWHHYWFSRLELDPDHVQSYRLNYRRFLWKWEDGAEFLRTYEAQTGAIYR